MVEEQISRLCEDHKLTTMSVMVQHSRNYVSVYLHWRDEGDNDDKCISGGGETFNAALEMALHDMRIERT